MAGAEGMPTNGIDQTEAGYVWGICEYTYMYVATIKRKTMILKDSKEGCM